MLRSNWIFQKVKIKINKRNLNKVKECLKLVIKLDFIHLVFTNLPARPDVDRAIMGQCARLAWPT